MEAEHRRDREPRGVRRDAGARGRSASAGPSATSPGCAARPRRKRSVKTVCGQAQPHQSASRERREEEEREREADHDQPQEVELLREDHEPEHVELRGRHVEADQRLAARCWIHGITNRIAISSAVRAPAQTPEEALDRACGPASRRHLSAPRGGARRRRVAGRADAGLVRLRQRLEVGERLPDLLAAELRAPRAACRPAGPPSRS